MHWLAVGIGGMLGALARYALMLLFSRMGAAWLPYATLTVNVVGCFAIGFIAQWAFHQEMNSHWWVIGVRVGLLGGLTTFSSFGLDVVREWQGGRNGMSLMLILLHCILGFGAVLAGMALARQESPEAVPGG